VITLSSQLCERRDEKCFIFLRFRENTEHCKEVSTLFIAALIFFSTSLF